MTQDKTTFAVVTRDHMGALRSAVFVSHADMIANVEPMPNEGDDRTTGIKLTVKQVMPGQFVVRSVLNGRRRKLEVLAGAVPAALVAPMTEFADIEDNRLVVPASAVSEEGVVAVEGLAVREQFAAGLVNDVVVLKDGATLVEMPGAIRVN